MALLQNSSQKTIFAAKPIKKSCRHKNVPKRFQVNIHALVIYSYFTSTRVIFGTSPHIPMYSP